MNIGSILAVLLYVIKHFALILALLVCSWRNMEGKVRLTQFGFVLKQYYV